MLAELFKIKPLQDFVEVGNATLIDNKFGIQFGNELFIPKIDAISVLESNQSNLNFAVDAFHQFYEEWKFYCTVQRIPKSSKFHISKFNMNRSYISVQSLYEIHLFEINFTKKKKDAKSFNEFAVLFFKLAKQKKRIVSLSEFVKSNMVSIYSSGLAFSIFGETNFADQNKNNYLLDPYYPVFRNLALMHNFLVDAKLPWTIVFRANANEPQLRPSSFLSVYEIELSLLIEKLRILWGKHVSEILNEEEQNKIDANNFAIDTNMFSREYIALKLREQGIHQLMNSDESIVKIKTFLQLNAKSNGITNSIFKLSNIKEEKNGNIQSIHKDWRDVFYR